MATKKLIAATVVALAVCVAVIGITTYLFGQFMQANSIGPDYCHNLATQDPSFGQSLDATTHFCDYNQSTQGYDFNRTKFIEALSHVES